MCCVVIVTFKMFNPKRALLYAFLLAVLLEPISGRRGFSGGHSYPKSGGLSGGGHRTGGLSGGGHGYPSSGGHGSPSSGGNHGYPAGGGMSGGGSSYPSSGAKPGYPSGGSSHGYPSSGGGLSGHGQNNKPAVHHTTNIHNYNYAPPQQISYSPVRGGPPQHYPVYHGTPPTYVYQYKNSGSKYGTLLAGLALLNLGTLGVAAYAASGHSAGRTQYTPQPGEVCKFAVKKDNGDYEETKIDCQIISSFILQDQAQVRTPVTNTQTSVVTVTNTTVMNTTMLAEHPSTPGPATPAIGNVLYAMLPNGTLVPVNTTGVPGVPVVPGSPLNATQNVTGALAQNGVVTSVTTTTTTNTTLVNALDVKGKAVEVTPGMQCFLIRNSPTHNMRKSVPCGLLQTYADKSIQRKNSAARNVPMFTIVAAILAFCVAY